MESLLVAIIISDIRYLGNSIRLWAVFGVGAMVVGLHSFPLKFHPSNPLNGRRFSSYRWASQRSVSGLTERKGHSWSRVWRGMLPSFPDWSRMRWWMADFNPERLLSASTTYGSQCGLEWFVSCDVFLSSFWDSLHSAWRGMSDRVSETCNLSNLCFWYGLMVTQVIFYQYGRS